MSDNNIRRESSHVSLFHFDTSTHITADSVTINRNNFSHCTDKGPKWPQRDEKGKETQYDHSVHGKQMKPPTVAKAVTSTSSRNSDEPKIQEETNYKIIKADDKVDVNKMNKMQNGEVDPKMIETFLIYFNKFKQGKEVQQEVCKLEQGQKSWHDKPLDDMPTVSSTGIARCQQQSYGFDYRKQNMIHHDDRHKRGVRVEKTTTKTETFTVEIPLDD